jgi:DNA-binding NarL/FixJ family response regulator
VQIVRGVFDDHKEEQIGCELGISRHTVNTYFQRIYRKLRVSSRPQLILRVMAEYLRLAASGGEAVGTSVGDATDED